MVGICGSRHRTIRAINPNVKLDSASVPPGETTISGQQTETRSRPKILFIAEYGIRNGGENSLLAILPHLRHWGWQPKVLLPPESEFESALRSIAVDTIAFVKHGENGQQRSQRQLREHLATAIQSANPDLVHCNSLSTSRLCGPITRKLGIQSVGHLRDIVKLSRRAIADINEIDLLVAVSQATQNWHVEQGIDPAKTQVVHNGVDLNRFFPASFDKSTGFMVRDELRIPANVPLLLFVGQIGIRKGVDILLDAFESIAKQHPACQLLIVGQRNSQKQESIDYESRLHQPHEHSQAAGRIHWLGRRTDVAEIMRQSTILIHPARQEPLGRVLLEAAACGLPMVTTDVGGSREILNSFSASELLQPLDAYSIAHRVGQLLENPKQLATLSLKLRVLAETRFSDRRCATAIAECYSQLLESPFQRGTPVSET